MSKSIRFKTLIYLLLINGFFSSLSFKKFLPGIIAQLNNGKELLLTQFLAAYSIWSFLAETGCYAIHGFSEETGDYAILGIAGIRYITYRQALHVPSLSSVPAPSSPHSAPVLSIISLAFLCCLCYSVCRFPAPLYRSASSIQKRQKPIMPPTKEPLIRIQARSSPTFSSTKRFRRSALRRSSACTATSPIKWRCPAKRWLRASLQDPSNKSRKDWFFLK